GGPDGAPVRRDHLAVLAGHRRPADRGQARQLPPLLGAPRTRTGRQGVDPPDPLPPQDADRRGQARRAGVAVSSDIERARWEGRIDEKLDSLLLKVEEVAEEKRTAHRDLFERI